MAAKEVPYLGEKLTCFYEMHPEFSSDSDLEAALNLGANNIKIWVKGSSDTRAANLVPDKHLGKLCDLLCIDKALLLEPDYHQFKTRLANEFNPSKNRCKNQKNAIKGFYMDLNVDESNFLMAYFNLSQIIFSLEKDIKVSFALSAVHLLVTTIGCHAPFKSRGEFYESEFKGHSLYDVKLSGTDHQPRWLLHSNDPKKALHGVIKGRLCSIHQDENHPQLTASLLLHPDQVLIKPDSLEKIIQQLCVKSWWSNRVHRNKYSLVMHVLRLAIVDELNKRLKTISIRL